MDRIYIDNSQRAEAVELPEYGEVKLIVKDGKVVQYFVTESHILFGKQPEKQQGNNDKTTSKRTHKAIKMV